MIPFATFTLSLTLGATHACDAWERRMVPGVCVDPQFPAETFPCPVMSPPLQLACVVDGATALTSTHTPPGELLMFDIYAFNSAGRSPAAEPILGVQP